MFHFHCFSLVITLQAVTYFHKTSLSAAFLLKFLRKKNKTQLVYTEYKDKMDVGISTDKLFFEEFDEKYHIMILDFVYFKQKSSIYVFEKQLRHSFHLCFSFLMFLLVLSKSRRLNKIFNLVFRHN